MQELRQILSNGVLWGPILSSLIAQLLKFTVAWVRTKKPDFTLLVNTGGMPSSHSASVSTLSTMVGIRAGFDSVLFAVTAFFSLIVMYDAAGLRRAAGRQAALLNRIVEELSQTHRLQAERVRELLGHTPGEVLMGALLGILIGVILG